jgi:Tol biopolymer transport system component
MILYFLQLWLERSRMGLELLNGHLLGQSLDEAQRLTDGKANEWPFSFSPDGKRLAFTQDGNGGSSDIFTAPVESKVRTNRMCAFSATHRVQRGTADGGWSGENAAAGYSHSA